ncbi:MAG: SH3 domain-containing protein [Caldilineaceae bacterium]
MAEAGDAEASDTEAGDTGETMMAETPAAEEEGAEDNAAMAEPTTAPTATTAPTVTNTPLPTPTPTQAMRPTPDADGRTTAQVAMSGSRLNIRSGPSTAFPVIGKALPREVFIVQGRNGDNTWVQLAVPDLSGGFGWVSTQFVVLSDPIATLPIVLETNDTAAPTSSTIAAELASAPTAPATTAQPATAAMSTTAAAAAQPAGLSGTMVLQSEWGGTFYLYELASGALRPVTGGLDPALSPDGSMIAFTRIGDGAGGLYLINRDGSDERQIFKASEQIMAPKWSPDGKWVVFSRANGSYTCNDIAFVGCISDGQLFPVPPGGLPPALEEARDEVLDGFERVSRPNWQLSRVNLDGKEYRDIAALDSARTPDWTNAGIVYQSAGGLQITQDTPDGDTRQVYHDGWDWDPDWQPNGGRIVFQSKEGPHWEIFAVNPDGTGLAALTRPVTTLVDELPSNVAPVWSPDGQYVAYLSNRMENNEAGPWRVWVMNADGSNQHPLPINLDINYGFAGEQMISWEQ